MKTSLARFGYLLAVLAVLSYALVTLQGPRGVYALFEKEARIRQMEQRNAALAREIKQKRSHIKRLTDDPGVQELEIRERLKLVRPGEKIFITGEPEKK